MSPPYWGFNSHPSATDYCFFLKIFPPSIQIEGLCNSKVHGVRLTLEKTWIIYFHLANYGYPSNGALTDGTYEKGCCSDSIWNFRVLVLQRQASIAHECLAKIHKPFLWWFPEASGFSRREKIGERNRGRRMCVDWGRETTLHRITQIIALYLVKQNSPLVH